MATALRHIVRALQLDPGHELAQNFKLRNRVKEVERLKEEGHVAFKQNRLEEAVERYGYGVVQGVLNRNEKALEASDESLELSPRPFKALDTRARIYLNLEKYDATIGDFKSAIREASAEESATRRTSSQGGTQEGRSRIEEEQNERLLQDPGRAQEMFGGRDQEGVPKREL
ncbi:hypothetical protein EST38_g8691 [Candolleomyces aberdarensis]|uniref:Uncharacterized protein n=1 Tax=Candolleomyces aberdarensis TaxID=2316362 RepID=A0A4Q2DCM3_9AGAR|nr:hypothetical protein EST38_g8691 [Candolleomyces aberdarensis]